jgi:hypothetical protein
MSSLEVRYAELSHAREQNGPTTPRIEKDQRRLP